MEPLTGVDGFCVSALEPSYAKAGSVAPPPTNVVRVVEFENGLTPNIGRPATTGVRTKGEPINGPALSAGTSVLAANAAVVNDAINTRFVKVFMSSPRRSCAVAEITATTLKTRSRSSLNDRF
jgi:hypothetical protein